MARASGVLVDGGWVLGSCAFGLRDANGYSLGMRKAVVGHASSYDFVIILSLMLVNLSSRRLKSGVQNSGTPKWTSGSAQILWLSYAGVRDLESSFGDAQSMCKCPMLCSLCDR